MALDNQRIHGSGTPIPAAESDTVDQAEGVTRGLYVGVAGALKFNDAHGVTRTYANAVAGYHPIYATRIWDNGTTASDIHCLY